MNDTGHVDDAPTTKNYTTGKLCLVIAQVCTIFCCIHITWSVVCLLIKASTAAEATGSEETAADYSALESFGPSDDQQVWIVFKLNSS
jgi:hypothetical protein